MPFDIPNFKIFPKFKKKFIKFPKLFILDWAILWYEANSNKPFHLLENQRLHVMIFEDTYSNKLMTPPNWSCSLTGENTIQKAYGDFGSNPF